MRLLVACALALQPAALQAQASPFDGRWQVTMTCPPHAVGDDEAKGYHLRFPVRIGNGNLQGSHGKEGEVGWLSLHGPVASDGSATLRVDGIVNNPDYAIKKAQRGYPYTYRVRAQFEQSRGSGQRLTGRRCDFDFTRDSGG